MKLGLLLFAFSYAFNCFAQDRTIKINGEASFNGRNELIITDLDRGEVRNPVSLGIISTWIGGQFLSEVEGSKRFTLITNWVSMHETELKLLDQVTGHNYLVTKTFNREYAEYNKFRVQVVGDYLLILADNGIRIINLKLGGERFVSFGNFSNKSWSNFFVTIDGSKALAHDHKLNLLVDLSSGQVKKIEPPSFDSHLYFVNNQEGELIFVSQDGKQIMKFSMLTEKMNKVISFGEHNVKIINTLHNKAFVLFGNKLRYYDECHLGFLDLNSSKLHKIQKFSDCPQEISQPYPENYELRADQEILAIKLKLKSDSIQGEVFLFSFEFNKLSRFTTNAGAKVFLSEDNRYMGLIDSSKSITDYRLRVYDAKLDKLIFEKYLRPEARNLRRFVGNHMIYGDQGKVYSFDSRNKTEKLIATFGSETIIYYSTASRRYLAYKTNPGDEYFLIDAASGSQRSLGNVYDNFRHWKDSKAHISPDESLLMISDSHSSDPHNIYLWDIR